MKLTRLQRQCQRLQRQTARLQGQSRFWSWVRLAIFLIFSLGSAGSFYYQFVAAGWTSMAAGLLLFLVAVRFHQRIQFRLYRHFILDQSLQAQIQRLERDWKHLPLPPTPRVPPDHPYARDLDLIGPGSLHHLCDTSISLEGSQKLADWLLQAEPSASILRQRQKMVQALQGRTLFRQALLLKGQETAWNFRHIRRQNARWEARELLRILEKFPCQEIPGYLLPLLISLASLHWLLHLGSLLGVLPAILWQSALGLYALLFWLKRKITLNLFQDAFQLDYEIRKLATILNWLEIWGQKPVPELQPILSAFTVSPPSQLFTGLQRIVPLASLQTNPLAWVLMNLAFPCDYWATWRFETLKPQLRHQLPLWLDKLAELEAVCSLANLAWLHPEYHFPDLSSGPKLLHFQAGGHPLLEPAKRIRNSLSLKQCGEICLLTGSNMAGKSTFIKSIGLNLVLAQAGGPVDAEVFQWQPLRLFACIRVQDSVTEGLSYFYAEVRRLKQLLEHLQHADPRPLLWLIDEIFRGTNNRERFLGSRAYIEALAHQPGAGLLTTHDLELTRIHTVPLRNFHFREEIIEGCMVFDYQLREGPCPTTNALRIMALEGLPVPISGEEKA